MALIKAKTNNAGITGNYWRVVRIVPPSFTSGITLDTTGQGVPFESWGYGTLTFELYRDINARKVENRTPLDTQEIPMPGSFFMGMTLVDDVSLVKRVIYERHGDIPGLEDATQDFSPDPTTPVDDGPATKVTQNVKAVDPPPPTSPESIVAPASEVTPPTEATPAPVTGTTAT